jgi:hypothetical protein
MQNEIKPGDQLYKVHYDSRMRSRDGHVTVKSVGPKWITTEGTRPERFDTQSLRGENSNVRLYLSKEIHDGELARSNAWQRLRRILDRHTPPEGVTAEALQQAIELLDPKQ